MSTKFILRYLKYYFTAGTKHDVHSPFIYDLVTKVIPDRWLIMFNSLEKIRKGMSYDYSLIAEGFGVFENDKISSERPLSVISHKSSKNAKYCRLLFRIVDFYKPAVMIEMGTAVGMSAMYIAKGNPSGMLHTIEGNENLARYAEVNFKAASLNNINLIIGKFENKLPEVLADVKQVDFIYIDGHHRLQPTLLYFEMCLEKSHKNTIFVFDDINWSDEMQDAWMLIKKHKQVSVTVDLFMMGLVFLDPSLSKQDFVIRY